ncbi:MAG: protein phosphatase CheZ [Gammaproteobacteria bacterium]
MTAQVIDLASRLVLARKLVQALESGAAADAESIMARLVEERDSAMFQELGRLTRELHDALRRVPAETRMVDVDSTDIADAKERLTFVIRKTEEAAHRTLTVVEQTMPVAQQMADRAGVLVERLESGTAPDAAEVAAFVGTVRADAQRVQAGLSEVLMAQDFQDLTGQVIRKIMDLVQDVERSLVGVIQRAATPGKPHERGADAGARAEGPAVVSRMRPHVVGSQDEVDDLLSSMGF